MKLTKMLGPVAAVALALMAFAGTASATTLTTNGVKQTTAVTLDWSMSGSMTKSDTSNTFANTCKASTLLGSSSSSQTGSSVSGPVSSLSFSNCTHELVVVDKPGSFSIEVIGSGPNGTIRSTGAEITEPATIGSSIITLNCKTSNTDLGTLTGTASGTSTIHINAVLNCGFFLPSARWVGTYNITGHSISATS
jgi:hypothetical protein